MMSGAVREKRSEWGRVLINIITFKLAENLPASETHSVDTVKINELRNQSQTRAIFLRAQVSAARLRPSLLNPHGRLVQHAWPGSCSPLQFASFVRGCNHIWIFYRAWATAWLWGCDVPTNTRFQVVPEKIFTLFLLLSNWNNMVHLLLVGLFLFLN